MTERRIHKNQIFAEMDFYRARLRMSVETNPVWATRDLQRSN